MGYQKPLLMDADYTIDVDGSNYICYNDKNNRVKVDTAADVVIQHALDQLTAPEGGKIYIKSGEYTINDTIDLYRNVAGGCSMIIQGSGINGTTLSLANGVDKDMFSFDVSGVNSDGWKIISDMRLNGNKANNTAGDGIHTETSGAGGQGDILLTGLFIYQFEDNGIDLNDAWGAHLYRIISEYHNGHGVFLSGTQLYLNQAFLSYNAEHGLSQHGAEHCYSNLNLRDNEKNGMFIQGDRNTFSNIVINDWGSAAANTYFGLQFAASADINLGSNISIWGDNNADSHIGLYNDGDRNNFTALDIAQTNSHCIQGGGTDNSYAGYWDSTFQDWGTRNLFNGLGTNAGNPGAAGNWNGQIRPGIIVEDTATNNMYIYSNGAWRAI